MYSDLCEPCLVVIIVATLWNANKPQVKTLKYQFVRFIEVQTCMKLLFEMKLRNIVWQEINL